MTTNTDATQSSAAKGLNIKPTPLPLWPISIRLPSVGIHIHADREMAFQVLTAFGASGSSSRILEGTGNRRLVEFNTEVKVLFGRKKRYRTVEWVTLIEPAHIDFEAVSGPLPVLRDRITLIPDGNCCRLRYESTVGVRGWVIGMLYVKPYLGKFMRAHVREVKETIESRARRSRVYPQKDCDAE